MHVPFADPYCPVGRAHAVATARASGWVPASSGTLVVIQGPRFSTRAESKWYAAQGWTLVGMTALPEAALARELALCYTTIALVTDTDAGAVEGEGVTHAEVFEVFAANVPRLRELVGKIIEGLPMERDCPCPGALDGIRIPFELPGGLAISAPIWALYSDLIYIAKFKSCVKSNFALLRLPDRQPYNSVSKKGLFETPGGCSITRGHPG